jgi:hypothetical protein
MRTKNCVIVCCIILALTQASQGAPTGGAPATGGAPPTGGASAVARRRYVGSVEPGVNYLMLVLTITIGLSAVFALMQLPLTTKRTKGKGLCPEKARNG